ncbi:MAG: thioesterase family protein [Coriobacteriia bacterium]|nr:thioesterase family protein [Coriobacteriia bacterium]
MEFKTTIEVRYSETDAMGIVYHANYLPWFEIARTHLLQEIGFPYAQMETQGYLSPVLSVNVEYGLPCRYGDTAVVYTTVAKTTPVRTEYSYRVFLEGEDPETARPRVTGSSTHCLVDAQDFKPLSLKRTMPELLDAYKRIIADNEAASKGADD